LGNYSCRCNTGFSKDGETCSSTQLKSLEIGVGDLLENAVLVGVGYDYSVQPEVESVNVVASAIDTNATIQINGSATNQINISSLFYGANRVLISVASGTQVATYVLTIHRAFSWEKLETSDVVTLGRDNPANGPHWAISEDTFAMVSSTNYSSQSATIKTWTWANSTLYEKTVSVSISYAPSIAIFGDTLVAGSGSAGFGVVIIFTRNGPDGDWTQLQILSDPKAPVGYTPARYYDARFGQYVSLYADALVVGATSNTLEYVHTYSKNAEGLWTFRETNNFSGHRALYIQNLIVKAQEHVFPVNGVDQFINAGVFTVGEKFVIINNIIYQRGSTFNVMMLPDSAATPWATYGKIVVTKSPDNVVVAWAYENSLWRKVLSTTLALSSTESVESILVSDKFLGVVVRTAYKGNQYYSDLSVRGILFGDLSKL
jgi:hypothetical protein